MQTPAPSTSRSGFGTSVLTYLAICALVIGGAAIAAALGAFDWSYVLYAALGDVVGFFIFAAIYAVMSNATKRR